LISARTDQSKSKSGKSPRAREGKSVSSRKSTRLLNNLAAQGQASCESYFESAPAEEILRLFEESYCSSTVNFLLDLKRSTAKRIFETVVRLKKKTYLGVISLYHFKEYLTNPLPMEVEGESGRRIPNYYSIIGLPREATGDDIRLAHKLLVSSFSADSFPPSDRKAGEERLRELNEAFDVLRNPKRRKEYDDTLPNINYLYPRRDQAWIESVTKLIS